MPSPWLLAVASVAHLLADAAGTIDLSNHTEVRGRSAQGVIPNPSLDLLDTATARLGLTTHEASFRIGYSATVLDVDAELFNPPLFLQTGDVGASWRRQEMSLGASEFASYGVENSASFGPLPAAPGASALPPPTNEAAGSAPTPPSGTSPMTPPLLPTMPANVQLLAAPQNLTFVSSRSEIAASDRVSPKGTLSLAVDYLIQGGTDAPSQTVLPLVQGPSAEAGYDEALSPRDGVELVLNARRSETAPSVCSPFLPTALLVAPGQPCEPLDYIEQAAGLWRHRIDPSTGITLGAGVAGVQVRLQDAQPTFDTNVLPVASASIEHTEIVAKQTTNEYRVDLALAPFIDFLSGAVDERLQLTASSRFPSRTVVYSATLGATQTVFSTFVEPFTSVQATADVEFIVSPATSLGCGARLAWQNVEGLGSFAMGMIYGALTLRVPTIAF